MPKPKKLKTPKPYWCLTCGETDPDNFYVTNKSKYKFCILGKSKEDYNPHKGNNRKFKSCLCHICGETDPEKFKHGKKSKCIECVKINNQKKYIPRFNLGKKTKIKIGNCNKEIKKLIKNIFGIKLLQDSVLLKNNGVLIKKYDTVTLTALDYNIAVGIVRKYAKKQYVMPDGNYFEIGEKSYQYTTIDNRIKISPQEYFIETLIANHGDIYLTDRVKYNGQYEDVELGCKKHGNYFKVNGGTMLRRTERNGGQKKNPVVGSCPICRTEYFAGIKEDMIAKFNAVHNNKYTYGEYVNLETSMKVYCKIHGEFEVMPYTHSIGGNKCPICYPKNMSIGEHRIRDYFERKKLNYIFQKTFDDCRNIKLLRFDFYLPKYNLIVEFDGYQHYGEVQMFDASLADIQRHDAIKNKYCEDNYINILRIPYWELEDNTVEWTLDNEITRIAAELAVGDL